MEVKITFSKEEIKELVIEKAQKMLGVDSGVKVNEYSSVFDVVVDYSQPKQDAKSTK